LSSFGDETCRWTRHLLGMEFQSFHGGEGSDVDVSLYCFRGTYCLHLPKVEAGSSKIWLIPILHSL